MLSRFSGSRRRRNISAKKSPQSRNRSLRNELLEPRTMLSGAGFSEVLAGVRNFSALAAASRTINTAPTVAQAINIDGNSQVTGKTAILTVLGRDNGGEANLVYQWSVTSKPVGATASFSTNRSNTAKNTTITFSAAGTYTLSVQIVDAGGLSTKTTRSVVVKPTLTSVRICTPSGQVVSANSSLVVPGTSQTVVAQGLDQFGRVLAVQPAFTWSVSTVPDGASSPSLSVRSSTATATFNQTGDYGFTVQAKASGVAVITRNVSMKVVQAARQVTNVSTLPVSVWGTSQELVNPTFLDQFGCVMETAPSLIWSVLSRPLNSSLPSISTVDGVSTVTFSMAGCYVLRARLVSAPSVSYSVTLNVNQTLTSIVVSPEDSYVLQGATQQFTATALDQFGKSMVNQQIFTWSVDDGTISQDGLFTAPTDADSCTVTVTSGSVTGTTIVTILANTGDLQNLDLAELVQTLDVDGSISRQDMIQILRSTGSDGVVDASEFSDLKKILNDASELNIPSYVQCLAADIINGNAANAKYQGQTLGNLAAGSSSTQLEKLIDKWFLGADHPTLCNSSLVYSNTAGSLFAHTPSHTDEVQGCLGDCYFISALGTLADSNPEAVENMFIDNGDGTYTVRFYTGTYGTIFNYSDLSISAGFTNNAGTADYVTVDSMLPTTASGMLVYAGYGSLCTNTSNTLWIALAEKAYAQWNETGKAGRDGLNAYASIQGGWMATVDAQVLGYNATDYIMSRTSEQVAIQALAANKAVTIGTQSWNGTKLGLYASHAYAIVAYDAATDTFTLYNPWGSNQPGQLTWAQLQATCTQMAIADTSGTTPIAGAGMVAGSLKASLQLSKKAVAIEHAAHAMIAASEKVFGSDGNTWDSTSRFSLETGALHGIFSASLIDATFVEDVV